MHMQLIPNIKGLVYETFISLLIHLLINLAPTNILRAAFFFEDVFLREVDNFFESNSCQHMENILQEIF